MAWLYFFAVLTAAATILFTLAYITGRNLADFAAAVILLLLTTSYIREILQRRRQP